MITSFVTGFITGKSYIDVLFTIGLMMSIGTAITGRMIKFYPVEFGGFIGMALSFALLPLATIGWQLPMFAAVFLFGQVIPGHLLNAHCKREARREEAAQNGRAK
jgi:predicted MFS family arabinose efflux permease